MRHTFAKLMAMLLVLVLMLTGCNLIDVDQLAVIGDERAELEKTYSAVLAEYDGGTVTQFDALAPFYSNYSNMVQLYSMFSMDITADEITSMKQDAVENEVTDRAIRKEFESRGLTLEKTEEEILAEAEESYQSSYEYYLGVVEGEDDAEKAARAELQMYSEGFTLNRLVDLYTVMYQQEALQAAVEAEIEGVTDEELQAAYEEKLAADEETYTENPTNFEQDATDETAAICWIPEGYRTVKHVLVIPEDDVLQAVTDARNALKTAQTELSTLETELEKVGTDDETRTAEEIQADIDAKNAELADLEAAAAEAEEVCLASVKETTDKIYTDLEAGESIDDVMALYGEDPGMQSEPSMTTGYYVCADSTTWDANFTAGAMALENVGDFSAEPVISTSGVHIIYYNSDVTPGAVALEDVRDALYEQELEAKRTEHYQSELTSWVEALNPVYHLDAWVVE